MTSYTKEQLGAYSNHQRGKEDNRETDARALLTCASRLNDVLNAGDTDKDAYAAAIRNNQKLWTFFQVAVNDPENPLPHDLKITLFNLSRYVDKTSFSALLKFSPDELKSLININRIIAAGLSAKPKEESTAPDVENIPVEQSAPIRTSA
jgi:flagellar protein FlaF